MDRVREYEIYAAECVLLSQEVKEPADRAVMLGIARGWMRLAELAEKHVQAASSPENPEGAEGIETATSPAG
jgi:hypothetical protein